MKLSQLLLALSVKHSPFQAKLKASGFEDLEDEKENLPPENIGPKPLYDSSRIDAAEKLLLDPKIHPTTRKVLELFLAGDSQREIASKLGISVKATYKHILKTKKKINDQHKPSI